MQELPLVFFTVLTQMVAGSFILLTVLKLCSPALANLTPHALTKILISFWCILTAAGIASIAHVGQPFRIINVIAGIVHFSPMSLEIISVAIFGALGVLATFVQWRTDKIFVSLMVLTAVVALSLLFVIANVYQLPGVSLWNTPWTVVNFVFSGFLSGAVLIGLLLRGFTSVELTSNSWLKFIWISILFLVFTLNTGYFLNLNNQTQKLAVELPQWLIVIQVIRVALICGALFVCINPGRKLITFKGMFIATIAIVIAELLGRIFFYELLFLAQL